jgi:7-carboxy-7-deazaguanine synthase
MADKIPVIEMFGPVYQGEGPLVGTKTWFLRTGGCDYLCKHCDSLHAVLPEQVKANRTLMTKQELMSQLLEGMNKTATSWLTLSGGNPVMWDLTEVIEYLHANGKYIAVETQGSVWRDWVASCDSIVISPKGPGMGYGQLDDLNEFLNKLSRYPVEEVTALKIPLLSIFDIPFAKKVAKAYPEMELFLSVGNCMAPATHFGIDDMRRHILDWARDLMEEVLAEPELANARIFPQQHVLVYGNEKGR